MRIPEQLICDLCEQEIAGGTPHAHIQIPMSKSQIDALLDANARIITPPPGILNLREALAYAMPKEIVLEAHVGCLTGIAPIFATAAARVVNAIIAEGIKRHERRQAAVAELEA